ncbi:hypothetical protein A8926_1727 [Saccharopolyspora spinosa]|uniref:Uncharacterized protein n=1 Tax=Saccharopolyspora spinosa TaxID=60894 RepID=A0A2N3XTW7_SACSN|nr:hypothetical protein A8926_1727 [Saccharopolyspora spinosa]
MQVRPVDERDASGEQDGAVFRVFLWSQPPVPAGVNPARIGWSNSVYELTGCDVHEAIEWASCHTPAVGLYTLYVCYVDTDGRMFMIRLAGTDPTRGDEWSG